MQHNSRIIALVLTASLYGCASSAEHKHDQADSSPHNQMPSPETMAAMATMGEAKAEHRWLQQLVGDWTCKMTMGGQNGESAMTLESTERIRALGDLWIVAEGEGESPMGPMKSRMTLGYDPAKQRFVGTWIDTMTTHMWIYDGSLDASKKVLTLETEGPDYSTPGKTAKFRDVITLESADRKVLTSWMQGPDGKWTKFMSVNYDRKN